MSKTTIQANWILTSGEAPLQNGYVSYNRESGRIESVGAGESARNDGSATFFLTPGLINAHTHLELHANEPIAIESGESMADWLLKVIAWSRPREAWQVEQACRQGILELIRTGTTFANDVSSRGVSLEALDQVGMRGTVSLECFYPAHHTAPDVSRIVDTFLQLQNRFADHPLLSVGLSPHAPYNITPQAVQAILAQISPALVHTHLAETPAEMAWFANGTGELDRVHEAVLGQRFGPVKTGVSPAAYFEAVLDSRWMAAHGVLLDEADVNLLAEQGVGVAHCPRSNLWLTGETIPDLDRLLGKGIAVGLGTDSRLSCPDLDLRAEGRVVMGRHGLSARQVFELMTGGSAAVVKANDCLGQLKPGYYADMVLWRYPAELSLDKDPYECWLSPETEVATVWINGRIVLERAEPASWDGAD